MARVVSRIVSLTLVAAALAVAVPADAAVRKKASVSARKHAAGARGGVSARAKAKRAAVIVPARPTFGQLAGLHGTADPLSLRSSVALVMDQTTNEVLFRKNSDAVLPIASLTKLMTATVVTQSNQSMSEMLTITNEDIDTEKNSRSRLAIGTRLSREQMLHLALMSSENRAAHALGRNYPGGMRAFVAAMNAKAAALGMRDTHYVEPTGLSSDNQSSARDLATLVSEASHVPLIRELSTSPEYQVMVRNRPTQFRTTNVLVKNPSWDIGLQKTGFINEAGQCLVMQAQMAGRKIIMVFLDSNGRNSRLGDAERVRQWVSTALPAPVAVTVKPAVMQAVMPVALPAAAQPIPTAAPVVESDKPAAPIAPAVTAEPVKITS